MVLIKKELFSAQSKPLTAAQRSSANAAASDDEAEVFMLWGEFPSSLSLLSGLDPHCDCRPLIATRTRSVAVGSLVIQCGTWHRG